MATNKQDIKISPVDARFENISSDEEEPLFVYEHPMDTVRHKLVDEMKLSYERIADLISTYQDKAWSATEVRQVLEFEAYPSREMQGYLLSVAGLELIAVKSLNEHITEGGHHYFAERCVFCGVNYYDNAMYDNNAPCDQRP